MGNSKGKLTKHKFMMTSKGLVSSLPHTERMNKESFLSFLKRYGHIVVKPSNGSGGAGVIQITSKGNGHYHVQYGTHQKTIRGTLPTYAFIQGKAKGVYLVQQGINLATINGRRFDLRVMVQKNKKSQWEVTGILAKIAGSGYFITNIVRSKGRAIPLEAAIVKSNVQGASLQKINKRIHKLAIGAVKVLQHHYPIHTVGIDMGVDTSGKVWIIEANFVPDKTYFLRLKDKTMYRRIMSYYHHHVNMH